MITETDSLNTLEFDNYYVILPSMRSWNVNKYKKKFQGEFCKPGFKYSSEKNLDWLTVSEIRKLVKTHINSKFEI